MVSGTLLSTDLKNGMQLQTLHNNTLTVSTTGGEFISRGSTLVNVYVDLVVFTRIAGTLKTGSGR